MSEKLNSVTVYHLSGDGLTIAFFVKGPDEFELVYKDQQGERKFTGRAIYQDKTRFGFVASVILEQVPDLHVITFSLAVPSANCPENMRSIPLKTFAVRTTSRTSIAGPQIVEGQIQIYETHVLEGNAW